jgi:TAG lipase/steryl ester hydrolase/phospholipase A2/LPA acyltransferase
MPLAKHAHRAFSTVWLFACDNVLTPILAHVVVWLEDKQWLNNPKQQCLDRLRNTMASAEDYATWSQCAERANRMNGFDEWRFNDDDADFDWKAMRSLVECKRKLRENQDTVAAMHLLSQLHHRRPTGLLSDSMFPYTTGTKKVVDEYFEEVEALLHQIVRSPDVRPQDKYVFFKRIAQNHGRTALMLSGGASLGMYHFGVIKALWQADLLPKVITGSSAGSIMASFVCTRPVCQIDEMFSSSSIAATLSQMNLTLDAFDPFHTKHAGRRMLRRLLAGGALMDVGRLAECIRVNIGDITFQEAYECSGRVLNVTVTSTREFQSTLVLNYLEAPAHERWGFSGSPV